MAFYRICHDYAHYDIISDHGVHTCSKCGRKFLCVMGDWLKGEEPTWVEAFSWARLFRRRR